MHLLAIEIGGTKLQITLGDAQGNLLHKQRFAVDRHQGAEGIQNSIRAGIAQLSAPPAAVGVGFGGPVDWQTGRVAVSHQIAGWSGFELADWLRSLVNVPVFVENDANVAALGEATFGAGKEFASVFYVTLGSGVGGGLVVDGRIFHGAAPGEAEIGHLRLGRAGTTLEERCSGWAVDTKVRQAVERVPGGILAGFVGKHAAGEARFLKAAIETGDSQAERILLETADDLAFGLSHAVHLFHPHVVVLGGGLSLIGEPLRLAVEEALPGYLMGAFQPGPPVRLATLGEDAVPVGALALAAKK